MIHEAAYRGRFSRDATRRALERANGRHRLHVLEDALELHERGSAGTRSRAEVAFLKAWGPGRPCVKEKVAGIEVDLHRPCHRVVVEIDGPNHARSPTRREDAFKARILESEGWTVLRVASDEVEHRPERAIEQVRRYLG